jgi:hypothetical protein
MYINKPPKLYKRVTYTMLLTEVRRVEVRKGMFQSSFGEFGRISWAPLSLTLSTGSQKCKGKLLTEIMKYRFSMSIRSYTPGVQFHCNSVLVFSRVKMYLSFREHCTSHCGREGTSAGCQRLVGQRSGP